MQPLAKRRYFAKRRLEIEAHIRARNLCLCVNALDLHIGSLQPVNELCKETLLRGIQLQFFLEPR